MTGRTYEALARLAHAHLDDDTARRWLALLRPAVQLVPAGPGQPVLVRLGGTPDLLEGTAWPEWPAHGPLTFIAEVDLEVLAESGLDAGLALPSEGRYLAFYFDDPEDLGVVVYPGDPETLPGSRFLHVTGTKPATDAAVELTGVQVLTWPGWEHEVLERAVLAPAGLQHLPDDFDEALTELVDTEVGEDVWGHHLGGWATPVQGPVELEVAAARLGESRYDDAHRAEADRWRPLLQVDSEEAAGTSWGDEGCLYWLARTDGSTPPAAADIGFTWQCS